MNRPNQEQNKETEDRDLEQNLNTDAGLQVLASELSQASPLQVTSQAALSQEVATHRSIFTRENLLKNTDPLLTKLGSKVKANGQFSIASYKNFQSKLFELNEATEGRNPAALNIIVKIILALLVIAAGIAILYFVLLIFALGSIFGGPSTSGAIILYLIAGGAITGMIFGLRAIINSKIDTRKRTAVPVLC